MTVGIGFCKYFFFCYIQYDTSSRSIDCSVPFLYEFLLSAYSVYGCNEFSFPCFFLFVLFFGPFQPENVFFSFCFLSCGDRLVDVCCEFDS